MSVRLHQSKAPDGMRIYAIGDVHGHLQLLRKLFDRIRQDLENNPAAHYRIILIGDYIDRGPDSAGCVEYLINLMEEDENIVCLRGNHEHNLDAFLNDPTYYAESYFTWGGKQCAESYGVSMASYNGTRREVLQKCEELKCNIPKRHREFFASLINSVTFGDYMFTHAGVRPGTALDKQTDDDLMWIRTEFLQHRGLYDKVIVHGHTPTYPMEILPNRINVDTHAYYTGILSCIVLENKEHRVIDVSMHSNP